MTEVASTMSSLAVSSRRQPSVTGDDAGSVTAGDSSTTQRSVVPPTPRDAVRPAASASPADVDVRATQSGDLATRTCAEDEDEDADDGGGGHAQQRMPDSVWSEFTETFRVIELAVSEGLRCSIDAPPPPVAFQPELEFASAVDAPPLPADRDNRQHALQVTV